MNNICLKIKGNKYDETDKYVCSESYLKANKDIKEGDYESISYIDTMEELINHCLVYNIDIEIPKEYNVITIYNIVFSTGNFDPEIRERSTCASNILLSSTDKKFIERKFKEYCKLVGKGNNIQYYKHLFIWHTEDFAYNQIIHSYRIDKSYLIEKKKI